MFWRFITGCVEEVISPSTRNINIEESLALRKAMTSPTVTK